MTNLYENLLFPSLRQMMHEKSESYESLRERHVQIMWLEQKFFTLLHTTQGFPIQILSPGIWNAEAGPDFLKAHIKIGQQELRGDIELHLTARQWEEHKHNRDSRYNQVILHVAFWEDKQEKELFTSLGESIYQCYLEKSLTIPIPKICQSIDIELYPYEQFVGSGRCAEEIFQKISEDDLKTLFTSASRWRLKQKWAHLNAEITDPSLRFLTGIAGVLGYKNNTAAFQQLFQWIFPFRQLPKENLLVLAMGVCGFFNTHFQNLWKDSVYYQQLFHIFLSTFSHLTLPQFKLHLHQIRPFNHPVRRLALLLELVCNESFLTLEHALNAFWERSWREISNEKEGGLFYKQLMLHFPQFISTYWSTHYTFEEKAQENSLSLLSDDLKGKILLNVFCPALFHRISLKEDLEQLSAFHLFYSSIPHFPSRKTRYLIHRFFGNMTRGKCMKQGVIEQGAYQLHRDFCLHYEASCIGCPFVDRYHASQK